MSFNSKNNFYDEIYIYKTNSKTIEIETNIKELKTFNNIIHKAYFELKKIYKNITGIKVVLKKNIPMQARYGWWKYGLCKFYIRDE